MVCACKRRHTTLKISLKEKNRTEHKRRKKTLPTPAKVKGEIITPTVVRTSACETNPEAKPSYKLGTTHPCTDTDTSLVRTGKTAHFTRHHLALDIDPSCDMARPAFGANETTNVGASMGGRTPGANRYQPRSTNQRPTSPNQDQPINVLRHRTKINKPTSYATEPILTNQVDTRRTREAFRKIK